MEKTLGAFRKKQLVLDLKDSDALSEEDDGENDLQLMNMLLQLNRAKEENKEKRRKESSSGMLVKAQKDYERRADGLIVSFARKRKNRGAVVEEKIMEAKLAAETFFKAQHDRRHMAQSGQAQLKDEYLCIEQEAKDFLVSIRQQQKEGPDLLRETTETAKHVQAQVLQQLRELESKVNKALEKKTQLESSLCMLLQQQQQSKG
jgi:hypothetical protein